jgi:hypothetical protein
MGDMSEEQEKGLEEFRKYLKDNNLDGHPMFDDYCLLRFLRARKFDQEKTRLMFNNFIEWRRENDVDNIVRVSYWTIKEEEGAGISKVIQLSYSEMSI